MVASVGSLVEGGGIEDAYERAAAYAGEIKRVDGPVACGWASVWVGQCK